MIAAGQEVSPVTYSCGSEKVFNRRHTVIESLYCEEDVQCCLLCFPFYEGSIFTQSALNVSSSETVSGFASCQASAIGNETDWNLNAKLYWASNFNRHSCLPLKSVNKHCTPWIKKCSFGKLPAHWGYSSSYTSPDKNAL